MRCHIPNSLLTSNSVVYLVSYFRVLNWWVEESPLRHVYCVTTGVDSVLGKAAYFGREKLLLPIVRNYVGSLVKFNSLIVCSLASVGCGR